MHSSKLIVFLLLASLSGFSQTRLSLKDAVDKGIANYGLVKAKESYAKAAQESVKQAKRDYLPGTQPSGRCTW
jgi:outer membrane protein TolC